MSKPVIFFYMEIKRGGGGEGSGVWGVGRKKETNKEKGNLDMFQLGIFWSYYIWKISSIPNLSWGIYFIPTVSYFTLHS